MPLNEPKNTDPYKRKSTISYKQFYYRRVRQELRPINPKRFGNVKRLVDEVKTKKIFKRYLKWCSYYGLKPQLYRITVANAPLIEGEPKLDGIYEEVGIENGHLLFKKQEDSSDPPKEIFYNPVTKGWELTLGTPLVGGDGYKRITREFVEKTKRDGLPPGKGWTYPNTEVSVEGGPRLEGADAQDGDILVSGSEWDKLNGFYTRNAPQAPPPAAAAEDEKGDGAELADGAEAAEPVQEEQEEESPSWTQTGKKQPGFTIKRGKGSKWYFEKDGALFFESESMSSAPPETNWSIDPYNYSGARAETYTKTGWQKKKCYLMYPGHSAPVLTFLDG